MFRIDFNAGAVFAQLDRARAAMDDMTPAYQDIGEYMVKATRERFVTGTVPDGTRWRQKSPTTLAEYIARGDGKARQALLDKKGKPIKASAIKRYLKRGGGDRPLIGPSGRLGKEILTVATGDAAEIGSSLEYSGVMQFGAKKGAFGPHTPWGDIPARVFLGISDEDERQIVNIVDRHLGEAFGERP